MFFSFRNIDLNITGTLDLNFRFDLTAYIIGDGFTAGVAVVNVVPEPSVTFLLNNGRLLARCL